MLNIIVLGFASLLTDISSEMVYPLLPMYLVTRLGVSPAIVGLIEGVAESLASLLKVFSGYFSDKLKTRKPFAILGYFCSTMGKVFFYVAPSWSFVFIGRVVDRFGKGIRTAPRDALIAESSAPGKRGAAFGLHRAMDSAGATLGVLGAYMLLSRFKGDMQRIFLLSLVPAVIAVAVLFLVREKRSTAYVPKERVHFRWSALNKKLRFFLICTFVFTLGNSSNQFLLLRAQNQGASLATVLLLYLSFNLIYALVSYPASRLSDTIGRKKILVAGYCVYAAVYLGFAVVSRLPMFWVLFPVYGLYMGFTEGIEKALISDIAPKQLRGTAIGLHAALVGIGLLPASLLAGLLWRYFGASAPFYFAACMGIVAAVGFWLVLEDD
jgi:MFS family permease